MPSRQRVFLTVDIYETIGISEKIIISLERMSQRKNLSETTIDPVV